MVEMLAFYDGSGFVFGDSHVEMGPSDNTMESEVLKIYFLFFFLPNHKKKLKQKKIFCIAKKDYFAHKGERRTNTDCGNCKSMYTV